LEKQPLIRVISKEETRTEKEETKSENKRENLRRKRKKKSLIRIVE